MRANVEGSDRKTEDLDRELEGLEREIAVKKKELELLSVSKSIAEIKHTKADVKAAIQKYRLPIIAVLAVSIFLIVFFTPMIPPSSSSVLIGTAKAVMSGNIPSSFIPYSLKNGVADNLTESAGKVIVDYAGMVNCQYCARFDPEVYIALSQFGTFGQVYNGVSLGDQNYPTIIFSNTTQTVQGYYWKTNGTYAPFESQETNLTSYSFVIGNSYSSPTVQFNSAEFTLNGGSGFYPPPATALVEAYPALMPLYHLGVEYGAVSNDEFGTPLESIAGIFLNGALTSMAPDPFSGSSGTQIIANATKSSPQSIYQILTSSPPPPSDAYLLSTDISADEIIAAICNVNKAAGIICSEYDWSSFFSSYG